VRRIDAHFVWLKPLSRRKAINPCLESNT
jgi:hypothetical protein